MNKITEYVVVDLETTGLNPSENEIIEIGALKIKDNNIVDRFSTMIKPTKHISSGITKLTGITNEMCSTAPLITEILPFFLKFIGDTFIVGHNVGFDMRFLKTACTNCGLKLENYCVDTLQMARRLIPEMKSHKLSDLCQHFSINNDSAHRALSDCHATFECFIKLDSLNFEELNFIKISNSIQNTYTKKHSEKTKSLQNLQQLLLEITCDDILTESEVFSLKKWIYNNQHLCGNYPFDSVKQSIDKALDDNILTQSELDELLEIFKGLSDPCFEFKKTVSKSDYDVNSKNVCLTGNFANGSRKEIQEFLKDQGAIVQDTVTMITDYLIVGSLGSKSWKCGNYGSKIKRAKELQNSGNHIRIIDEESFFRGNSKKDDDDYILQIIKQVEVKHNTPALFKVELLKDGKTHSVNFDKGSMVFSYKTVGNVFRITAKGKSYNFYEKTDDYYDLIENLLSNAIMSCNGYYKFGCCHLYRECSDAKKCLEKDVFYSLGCYYRKNLEKGIIFYGKNKNN